MKNPLGHYLYVQESNGSYFTRASLRLKQILKPCAPTCELEFYYHMFGKNDQLFVYLNELNGFSFNGFSSLLELNGDFGDKWNLARIPLGRISKPFGLDFDAFRLYNYDDYDLSSEHSFLKYNRKYSNLKIFDIFLLVDDIKLVNCEFPIPRPFGCPSNYFQCESKGCISSSRLCDLVDDCGDNSDETNCFNYTRCDFENGLCNWKNDLNNTSQWKLAKGF